MEQQDVLLIAHEIEAKIKEIDQARKLLGKRAKRKSEAISEYDKQLAITIIKIKNGEVMEFEGKLLLKLPAVTYEKIARGICWKEKLELETAEALYKNVIVTLQALQAELNGYQSIFRYLEDL